MLPLHYITKTVTPPSSLDHDCLLSGARPTCLASLVDVVKAKDVLWQELVIKDNVV